MVETSYWPPSPSREARQAVRAKPLIFALRDPRFGAWSILGSGNTTGLSSLIAEMSRM
jgi:hypothetical protein